MMKRISSGIIGFDHLVEGGFRRNTINAILGSAGTGKTTFGIQFLLEGLNQGQHGLYISLEERPKQLIREAKAMGFVEIKKFIDDGKLIIKYSAGRNIAQFMRDSFPKIIDEYKRAFEIESRIFIDPLTPILWEIKERAEQRELLSNTFHNLRKLGTTLVSVEEPKGTTGMEFTEETAIPIYLSDSVLHVQYIAFGGLYDRTLRIMKFRASSHGQGVYPFTFVRGLGIVVLRSEGETKKAVKVVYNKEFKRTLELVEKKAPQDIKNILTRKIKLMEKNWSLNQSPNQVLKEFCKKYGL